MNKTPFILYGFISFDGATKPGFHLPLFQQNPNKTLYVQISNHSLSRIVAFKEIELSYDDQEIVRLDQNIRLCVNNRPIFVFLNLDGKQHIGNLLYFVNNKTLNDNREFDLSTKLQIAELSGSTKEKVENRLSVLKFIQDSYGTNSSSELFLNTTVSQDFFSTIMNHSVNDSARNELERAFSDILSCAASHVLTDGPDWLWERIGSLIDVPRSEIVHEFRENIKSLSNSVAAVQVSAEEESSNNSYDRFVIEENFSAIGRQEERISFILKELLVNPRNGTYILKMDRDEKGQLARRAIRYLAGVVPNITRKQDMVTLVSSMIEKLYTWSFPLNRGILLYYLAFYLNDWEEIAKEIDDRVRRSGARNVNELAAPIRAILASSTKAPS